jgi:hypothetical protein
MTDEALRQKILSALANGPLSFVSLHAKIGGDSRHLMHMLQVLGNQKLVTFSRTDGWALTDEADVEPSAEPEAPTVRRIEGVQVGDGEAPQGAQVANRLAGSVSARVLAFLRQTPGNHGVPEIVKAIDSYAAAVYIALGIHVQKGRVAKSGARPDTRYTATIAVDTIQAPETKALESPAAVDETPVNSETVAVPVRQPKQTAPEAEQPTAARSQRWISLRIPVPIEKAAAVIRAIEQALA